MTIRGPCARRVVHCTIRSIDGWQVTGENWCRKPQRTCPRDPGEGYEKCHTICHQEGHAEEVALRLAGPRIAAGGAVAIIEGHSHACKSCQEALFAAGVTWLRIEPDRGPIASLVPLQGPRR